MPLLLETDRLFIRNWEPESKAEQAFVIYGDAEVMQFIGTGETAESVEAVREKLQQRYQTIAEQQQKHGFWAVVEKQTQQPIGTLILKQLPDGEGNPTADWEIGWHFRRAAWGQGYATESAQAVLSYALNTLKLPVVYAVANPENQRSLQVMQRLHMTPLGLTDRYYGQMLELYAIPAAEQ